MELAPRLADLEKQLADAEGDLRVATNNLAAALQRVRHLEGLLVRDQMVEEGTAKEEEDGWEGQW